METERPQDIKTKGKRKIIAVIGGAEASEKYLKIAEEVGRLIAEKIPEHKYIEDMKNRDPVIATLKGKGKRLREQLRENGLDPVV